MPPRVIRFYSMRSDYKEFSNFYKASIDIDGETYPTVEHYYQAAKFADDDFMHDLIKGAPTPTASKELAYLKAGRWATDELKKDIKLAKAYCKEHGVTYDAVTFEAEREVIMWNALVAKFTQHPHLERLLLSTGDYRLVEASPTDAYWGEGKDGKGLNRLGELLMELRAELRTSA